MNASRSTDGCAKTIGTCWQSQTNNDGTTRQCSGETPNETSHYILLMVLRFFDSTAKQPAAKSKHLENTKTVSTFSRFNIYGFRRVFHRWSIAV
ncbi:hypothetical protein ACFJIU_10120 [Mesorhizobium sp. UC74_2]|uniref:hypothetical protein n=1 Tax=Mesorhizobium sp. UC74_2 TaxID=3350171 RepID=UPI00366CF9AA